MKITFLENSGFLVLTDRAILVFDYFHDPAHKVVKTLGHYPGLPVLFFVSHNHKDHFNPDYCCPIKLKYGNKAWLER